MLNEANKEFCYTYISLIDANQEGDIFSLERINEINSVKSQKTKREKTASWVLFEKILKDKFNIKSSDIFPKRDKNGKWFSDYLYFSFSHSKDLVMVTISSHPVGVDIQVKEEGKYSKTLAKTLSIEENEVNFSEDKFYDLWTKREAYFKKIGEGNILAKNFIVDFSTKNLYNNYSYNSDIYVAAISCEIFEKNEINFIEM